MFKFLINGFLSLYYHVNTIPWSPSKHYYISLVTQLYILSSTAQNQLMLWLQLTLFVRMFAVRISLTALPGSASIIMQSCIPSGSNSPTKAPHYFTISLFNISKVSKLLYQCLFFPPFLHNFHCPLCQATILSSNF